MMEVAVVARERMMVVMEEGATVLVEAERVAVVTEE